jgi:hypothetical protein
MAEYDHARQALHRAGMARVQALTGKGVATLEELLDAKEFPAVRLGAARTVLELGMHPSARHGDHSAEARGPRSGVSTEPALRGPVNLGSVRARVARLAGRRENRVTLEDLVVGSFHLDTDADAPSSRTESAPPGSLVAILEELIVGSSRSSKTDGE